MTYFEDLLAKHTSDRVRKNLTKFHYSNSNRKGAVSKLISIKERISSGSGESQIIDDGSFELILSVQEYSDSLQKDFVNGINRIHKLTECLNALREAKCPVAWQVTTTYYIAFFSAIEVIRANGEFISFITENEAKALISNSPYSESAITAGSYHGYTSIDPKTSTVTITFKKSSTRHHQFAWKKVASIIKASHTPKAYPNITKCATILHAFGLEKKSLWPTPSDTRNIWNYTDPTLFSEKGNSSAKKFSYIATNRRRALSWLNGKPAPNVASLEDRTCCIAFSSAFLLQVLHFTQKAIISDSSVVARIE